MTLKVVSDSLNLRTVPSSKSDKTIIVSLRNGDLLVDLGKAGDGTWQKVRTVEPTPKAGYVKRKLVAQVVESWATPLPDVLKIVDDVLWDNTKDFDKITYHLGSKVDKKTGKPVVSIDCSGWTSFLCWRIFDALNLSAGKPVFDASDKDRLNTHSDGQVVDVGINGGMIVSGTDITKLGYRSGLLIGINNADYSWELGQGRVFEIDHIVMTMTDPKSGKHYITQSSSSGGGVNKILFDDWIEKNQEKLEKWRLHASDPLLTGNYFVTNNWNEEFSGPPVFTDPNPALAPAG